MSKHSIIGLAGTNGSGKDTVGHILAEYHGYLFVPITDLLRDEAKRRGLEVTRENLRGIGNEWRREFGVAVLVDKAIAAFEPVKARYKGIVMASLRNPGEADRVHELGGTVIWVDADPRVRYDRIQANAAARDRVGEDSKTFEQFLAEEQTEMNRPNDGDAASLNMSAVRERCDVSIDNTTANQSTLLGSIKQALDL